ncbi:MAG: aldose epimerase family protein [Lachnospiraceae bacterium]
MSIKQILFGFTDQNVPLFLYRLENKYGAYVTVTNYGCRVTSLFVPDKNNRLTNVVLGFCDSASYLKDDASLGAVVGRYANRIANASFSLNGKDYTLAKNNGANHLHGGPTGFANRVWDASPKENSITFTRLSVDGEEGFPGNLKLSVTYQFTDDNTLNISYYAETDADTILNLTNHTYFNLNGEGGPLVYSHILQLNADQMTEIFPDLIPTGQLQPVEKTVFDFRVPKSLGPITTEDLQYQYAKTYDHNFVLSKPSQTFAPAAIIYSPTSGIELTCSTDQPGLQLYIPAGNVAEKGYHGEPYTKGSAFCLETQHYPDSIHHANFPSVVLKSGDCFSSKTSYHFSIKN